MGASGLQRSRWFVHERRGALLPNVSQGKSGDRPDVGICRLHAVVGIRRPCTVDWWKISGKVWLEESVDSCLSRYLPESDLASVLSNPHDGSIFIHSSVRAGVLFPPTFVELSDRISGSSKPKGTGLRGIFLHLVGRDHV